jgi:hypothetical protein
MIREDMWQDMLAITKVLVAYGCLSSESSLEVDEFVLDSRTPKKVTLLDQLRALTPSELAGYVMRHWSTFDRALDILRQ